MRNILGFDAIWSGRSRRCFRTIYFLYLQGRRVSEAGNESAANINNRRDIFKSETAKAARNNIRIHPSDYWSIVMGDLFRSQILNTSTFCMRNIYFRI